MFSILTHLGECAIVPDVTMVGEAVAHKTETTFLDVLLDGVERLLFGNLHLRVSPARNLYDHVEDSIALVGKEGNIVEGRDNLAVLFDEDTVIWGRIKTRFKTKITLGQKMITDQVC
jgi:hypothetical protein